MKVEELKGDNNTANIVLTPEHPAEIALVNLLEGCEASCSKVEPMNLSADPNTTLPAMDQTPKLRITVQVKKSRY